MRKIFTILILFFSLISLQSKAEDYYNEWIDHSLTYYKFKINATGLYRITYSTMKDAGVPDSLIVGSYMKLFHNGNEIPIFPNSEGIFSTTGYFEFYGEINDGKPDTKLYPYPEDQCHTYTNLFTDSSTYFLTFSPNTVNSHFSLEDNNITNTIPKETSYWYTYRQVKLGGFNFGKFPVGYDYVTDSEFETGEGLCGGLGIGPVSFPDYIFTDHIYHGGSDSARFSYIMINWNCSTNYQTDITIGSSANSDFSDQGYGIRRISFPIKTSDLADDNYTIVRYSFVTPGMAGILSMIELSYPREFNAKALPLFKFNINKNAATYFEINNYPISGNTAALYDFNNKKKYLAVNDIPNQTIKFQLPSASNIRTNLMVFGQNPTDYTVIPSTALSTVRFVDYRDADLQGNYIIIGSKRLIASTTGENYLEAYKDFRGSPEGGGYIAKLVYIEDIEDQFAYGIRNHSLSIRNFINFGLDNFVVKPELVFLIGKAMVWSSCRYDNNLFTRCLIPTYGDYPSDYLLAGRSGLSPAPQIGIGRLSAYTGDDIKGYLDKIKEYEAARIDTLPSSMTPENKEWMKRVMLMAGGSNNFEQSLFKAYITNYKNYIEAPQFGGKTYSFNKTSSDPIQIATGKLVDSLINNGVSLITFFGHSSTSSIDFNLEPTQMQNQGKYFTMVSNGCFVGSIFEKNRGTVSENFVLLPNKAAVAYIAPVTYGFAFPLNIFTNEFYRLAADSYYNKELGLIMKASVGPMMASPNYFERMTGQQMTTHGDPAIRLNTFTRPDYFINTSSIIVIPEVVSTSTDSFQIKVVVRNLGRAYNVDYTVNIERIYPDGSFNNYSIIKKTPANVDTVIFTLEVDKLKGSGLNYYTVKVDYANEIDELSEDNNEVAFSRFIYSDVIDPLVPYQFAIVNNPTDFKLIYSTADPLSPIRSYVLQIDTTENFNSPLLETKRVSEPGGVIEWQPNITRLFNKVYYWRGALDTTEGSSFNWNTSSFLYNTSLSTGWNQSHYFQFLKDQFYTMELPNTRVFKYPESIRTITVRNGGALHEQLIESFFDGSLIGRNAFDRASMMFFVYDTKTGKPLESTQIGTTGFGPYGNVTRTPVTTQIIEFNTSNQSGRQSCINFINNVIPEGAIVFGYSFKNPYYNSWGADSISFGQNLFQAFESIGVSQIRQLTEGNPFVYMVQKGNPTFPSTQIEKPYAEVIDTILYFSGVWNKGAIKSTKLGPATSWHDLSFDWTSLESPSYDVSKVDVYGIKQTGETTLLFQNTVEGTTPLNIDGNNYPYLQLNWNTEDDSSSTAPQMNFWRVTNDPVPEGVINPSLFLTKSNDTIEFGQTYNFSIAFQNITAIDMDSILVRFQVKDANNNTEEIYKRFAPLLGNGFIKIDFSKEFASFSNFGRNTIIVEANPGNDQVEQYHFNNFAIFYITVSRDNTNPLLDVTFDGRHIIDGEIVSPTPDIVIKLKDENKYLALNDSTAFKMFLAYPSAPDNPVLIDFNQPNIKFIPADPDNLSEKNEAKILFNPELAEDGTYELSVQGADRSFNDAGYYEYRVKFDVDHKPAISNFLNYPNPFSTSTRFVFTLTGSETPDDIRIQIMTTSGRVVREITQDELGPLHIGNNISQFAWDGTDQYGDRLANGLYFYKVKVKMGGKIMDTYSTNADSYFDKGIGKMYLVR